MCSETYSHQWLRNNGWYCRMLQRTMWTTTSSANMVRWRPTVLHEKSITPMATKQFAIAESCVTSCTTPCTKRNFWSFRKRKYERKSEAERGEEWEKNKKANQMNHLLLQSKAAVSIAECNTTAWPFPHLSISFSKIRIFGEVHLCRWSVGIVAQCTNVFYVSLLQVHMLLVQSGAHVFSVAVLLHMDLATSRVAWMSKRTRRVHDLYVFHARRHKRGIFAHAREEQLRLTRTDRVMHQQ